MKTTQTKRPTDLFKPLRRHDTLRGAYLYSDGHAIAHFERWDPETATIGRYYKQIDNLGVACHFKGRIVFHGAATWLRCMLASGASVIGASAPSLENGSEATKAKGIMVGHVHAETDFGSLYDYEMPSFHSGDCHYQADITEDFDAAKGEYCGTHMAETLITKISAPATE